MSVQELQTNYAGRKPALFGLAFKTTILTILTLGFYRFWMKTRVRRFYWSAIRPGGQPLEYAGRPTEKLLGFLTAVVFLAFYIGIVNLILMFLSFSFFNANQPAYLVSFVGLVPVIFFAQYRARRYILARTRWRGIRFGLEPGVSGFVWRSVLHWGLTVMTFGLYWPIKAFRLEKYRTDRTWYGDQKLEQGGTWKLLLRPMLPLYGAWAMVAIIVVISFAQDQEDWLLALFVPGVFAIYGLAHWKAHSFKRLTEAKTLGDVRLATSPRVGRIIGIYAGGYMLMNFAIWAAVFLVLIVVGASLAGVQAGMGNGADFFDPLLWEDGVQRLGIAPWVFAVLGGVLYFAVFLFYRSLAEVFITLPMARHFAEVTQIVNPQSLDEVRQRDRDEFAEAEGFADALPLGEGM